MSESQSPFALYQQGLEREWFANVDKGVADTFVYRYFDAEGRLLYVGQTIDPVRRDRFHSSRAPWFSLATRRELSQPLTKAAALWEEFHSLNSESPIYNQTRANGHRGPGSGYWLQQMSELYMRLHDEDPDLIARDKAHMAGAFEELLATFGVSLSRRTA